MPKLCEVIGGTKTEIFFVTELCLRCILAAHQTIKLGPTKQNHQGTLTKSCILYLFTGDVQTHDHRHQYTVINCDLLSMTWGTMLIETTINNPVYISDR
jgi:hypothetical protein